ncbi:hypothetical protein Sjap_003128 [Stephania japonica]|uniref:Uncharacterized protein n=1 Tax=Stephania japonica TaxID=461633 RepID=A0AAP0PT80_9MAGN
MVSISEVTSVTDWYLSHTFCIPSGEDMRLRKMIFDSFTPVLIKWEIALTAEFHVKVGKGRYNSLSTH